MKNQSKADKIKATLKATRERRSSLVCKTYCVKLDSSHFNKNTIEKLKMIFLEAKWFYNFALTQDLKNFDTKIKEVKILNKEKVEEVRFIKNLSSQMKQGLLTRIIYNCVGLKESKKKGRRVGKLKFKTVVNSVPLNQFGNTFRIISKNHIKIQGIKQRLRVRGLKQIKNLKEIANATLTRKCGSYYLHVTGYEEPKVKDIKNFIGIDFGIKTDLTFSNGIKVNCKIPVSGQIKKLQRRIARSKKDSKNRWKLRTQLQKAYARNVNQRKDIKNKIASYLKKNYKVSIQDEMIKQWQSGRFGKAISESAIGEIKRALRESAHTHIVSKSFPSTKLCPKCGSLNSIPLSQRIYKCDCGYEKDRDLHSAINILMERKEYKPLENETSAAEMFEYFKTIPNIEVSLVQ